MQRNLKLVLVCLCLTPLVAQDAQTIVHAQDRKPEKTLVFYAMGDVPYAIEEEQRLVLWSDRKLGLADSAISMML